jgi:hypothetical protein
MTINISIPSHTSREPTTMGVHRHQSMSLCKPHANPEAHSRQRLNAGKKKAELRKAHYSGVVSVEADGANLPGRQGRLAGRLCHAISLREIPISLSKWSSNARSAAWARAFAGMTKN